MCYIGLLFHRLLRKEGRPSRSRCIPLGDGVLYKIGRMAETAEEFSPVHRIERGRFWVGLHKETIRVKIDIKYLRQIPVVIGFDTGAEDDTIRRKIHLASHRRIKDRDTKPAILKGHPGFLLKVVPDEYHSFAPCLIIIGFIESIGSHISVKDIDIDVRVLLFQFESILYRMTTADTAAVRVFLIPCSHTL